MLSLAVDAMRPRRETCRDEKCPLGEFMDNYGYCHKCSSIGMFEINKCISTEDLKKLCPNRTTNDQVSCIVENCLEGFIWDGYAKECVSCDVQRSVDVRCLDINESHKRCPKRTVFKGFSYPAYLCKSDTFMGNDGKCYDCSEQKAISIYDIYKDKVLESCPNRKILEKERSTFRTTYSCYPKTCPNNTVAGDDGKCHDCYSSEEFEIRCVGHDEVFKICPNRYTADNRESLLTPHCKNVYDETHRCQRMFR